MSDQTDPKFSDPNLVVGTGEEDANRAPEGDGNRAEFAQYGAEDAQFSIFDGHGNEQVVVVTGDSEGKPVMPTGDTAADARAKADKDKTGTGTAIGDGYSPEKV